MSAQHSAAKNRTIVSTEWPVTPPAYDCTGSTGSPPCSLPLQEMIQRVNVRSVVAAHGNRVGRGTAAVLHDEVAVLLGQPENERRVSGKVRHPDEVGLCQVVDSRME